MRTTTIIIFLLFLSRLGLLAQELNKDIGISSKEFNNLYFKTKPPVFSGRIINASKQELDTLSIDYSLVTPFAEFQIKGNIPISADGSFKLQLDYPFPYQQIWIGLGDYYYGSVYVDKGLYLELDMRQLKTNNPIARYFGKDGLLNDWLSNFKIYKSIKLQAVIESLYNLDVQDPHYLLKLDSLHSLRKSFEDKYIALNPSPYSWVLENETKSDYYSALIRYAIHTHSELISWNKIKDHRPKLISNSGMVFHRTLCNYLLYWKAGGDRTLIKRYIDPPFADVLSLQLPDEDVKKEAALQTELINAVKTPWVKSVLKNQQLVKLRRLDFINNTLMPTDTKKIDSIFNRNLQNMHLVLNYI